MNRDEKSREGPLLLAAVLAELRLLLPPRRKLCLGESGEGGMGEAGLFGQLHLLLVARRLSGLWNPSAAGSKTG